MSLLRPIGASTPARALALAACTVALLTASQADAQRGPAATIRSNATANPTAHASGVAITTIGNLTTPITTSDAQGNLYALSQSGTTITRWTLANGTYTPTTLNITLTSSIGAGGISVDASGNIFLADHANSQFLEYHPFPNGSGYSRSVLANPLNVTNPTDVAVAADGTIFGCDATGSGRVFSLDPTHTYNLSVVATSQSCARLAVDAADNVYISSTSPASVVKYTNSSGSYTRTFTDSASFTAPAGIRIDAAGNILVVDSSTGKLTKETPATGGTYTASTLATLSAYAPYANPNTMGLSNNGTLFVGTLAGALYTAQTNGAITPSAAVGGRTSAALTTAVAFTVDVGGTFGTPVALTKGSPNADFKLDSNTCSGTLGTGATCFVNVALAPTVPGSRLGAVELTSSSGAVLATAFVSGTGTGPLGVVSPGTITAFAGSGVQCTSNCGADGSAATAAKLTQPIAGDVDGAGNVYILDVARQGLFKIAPDGTFTTPILGLTNPNGLAIDGVGGYYISGNVSHTVVRYGPSGNTLIAGTNRTSNCADNTCGDGGLATSAVLSNPHGLTLDAVGNLYIADFGHNRIRKVNAATGIITTVAGNGSACGAGCGDGGLATSAGLSNPWNAVLDAAGNLYISDSGNSQIRKVDATTGIISTVVNTSGTSCTSGTCGDGGSATAAGLYVPQGIDIDAAGNLYIADYGNQKIRKVNLATQTISTVAGSGATCGSGTSACGDNGIATSGSLLDPHSVTVDGQGNLYITDSNALRVRKVSGTPANQLFANTAVGSSSAVAPLTFSNNGNDTLTFPQPSSGSNPSLSANFSYGSGSNCPVSSSTGGAATLLAGTSCPVNLQYTPTASGIASGQLTFTDNSLGATNATQSVTLAGTTMTALYLYVSDLGVNRGTTGTLQFSISFVANAAYTGIPTLTVNGSATGVGTITCSNAKPGRSNCSAPYDTTTLPTGVYTIAATAPADSNYTTTTANGTLNIR